MPYLSQNHPIADWKKIWWTQAIKMLTEYWTAKNIKIIERFLNYW